MKVAAASGFGGFWPGDPVVEEVLEPRALGNYTLVPITSSRNP